MRRSLLSSSLLSTSLTLTLATTALAQQSAPALTYRASDAGRALEVWRGDVRVTTMGMPCRPSKLFPAGPGRLAATCEGRDGVLIISTEQPERPVALEILGFEGQLKEVYMVEDRVWVDLGPRGARPLSLAQGTQERASDAPAAASPPPAAADAPAASSDAPAQPPQDAEDADPSPTPTAPTAIGRVLKTQDRDVVIDVGTAQGFRKDQHIEFFTTRQIDLGGESVARDEVLARGRIKSVAQTRAVVEIGLNEALPQDAKARHSVIYTQWNPFSPPRTAGVTEYTLTVRPFLAIGALGGGAIMDASITHRFDSALALDLMLSPLGFVATNQGGAGAFAAHGLVSYDSRVFQLGLGLGLARAGELPNDAPYQLRVDEKAPATGVGVSAAQLVRLGARDGLSLTAMTNFMVQDGAFRFGGLNAQLQLPVSMLLSDSWLIMRGGGGLPGHIFGELGLRTLIQGSGHAGSFLVTPTIGAATVSEDVYEPCQESFDPNVNRCRSSVTYGGPMVGVTLEWRR